MPDADQMVTAYRAMEEFHRASDDPNKILYAEQAKNLANVITLKFTRIGRIRRIIELPSGETIAEIDLDS